jgi:hypothetical protein
MWKQLKILQIIDLCGKLINSVNAEFTFSCTEHRTESHHEVAIAGFEVFSPQ